MPGNPIVQAKQDLSNSNWQGDRYVYYLKLTTPHTQIKNPYLIISP